MVGGERGGGEVGTQLIVLYIKVTISQTQTKTSNPTPLWNDGGLYMLQLGILVKQMSGCKKLFERMWLCFKTLFWFWKFPDDFFLHPLYICNIVSIRKQHKNRKKKITRLPQTKWEFNMLQGTCKFGGMVTNNTVNF